MKLAAVDIDGTLVTAQKELLPDTKRDIQAFVSAGGAFVLATGRPTPGIRRYVSELQLETIGGWAITYNGAKIFNLKSGALLLETAISVDCYPQIFRAAGQLALPLTAYRGDIAVTQDACDAYFIMETTINGLKIERVADLQAALTYPTPKFLITGEPSRLAYAEPRLRDALQDLPLQVFRSEPFFLEITAAGCDKGAALLQLADALGIDRASTMACGDGFNDVTMLRAAGLGVAMKNAQEPAKAAAQYITASNAENGVGLALRKFADMS